jgi:hypothetical protein
MGLPRRQNLLWTNRFQVPDGSEGSTSSVGTAGICGAAEALRRSGSASVERLVLLYQFTFAD